MARRKKRNDYLDDVLTKREQEELENEELEEELVVETTEQADYNNTVKLQNLIGAQIKLPGSVSGKFYVWEKAGAVVEVDERDAPELLAKALGQKRCCGSANSNLVFQIYKE